MPVFTKYAGVNLDGFGIVMESPTIAALSAAIDSVLLKSGTEMKENAKKTANFVQKNYTFEHYKATLQKYISNELNNTKQQ